MTADDDTSVESRSAWALDATASEFKLAAEAQRISLAALSDPMVAVATSDVRPLPHQLQAVYGELLPRTPLRFLLADDPGAGKTIMAGLYIKELMLRDDVRRCLVVAPGGLVDQWQQELQEKFSLQFQLLTPAMIDESPETVFADHPLLIARMDQLSRNENLKALLQRSEWDLIIVDEAHRMGVHYSNNKLHKTKRFQLGELLGKICRHLLLMTATPHSGKEEDFQAFLTLLDRDRFEGRADATVDLNGIWLRRTKEEMLTFEGTSLFPPRVAESVEYTLTPLEQDLYEQVTEYVRTGMNRAAHLKGNRRNSVGFALTVLQRRLASSPEAIHQSLIRRAHRLQQRRREMEMGVTEAELPHFDMDHLDGDDYNAAEVEALEEELLDAATASQTITELDTELQELDDLIRLARTVREGGTDRKWLELSSILQEHAIPHDPGGSPRKLIVFTEHRDTLEYLASRITSVLGHADAVRTIHGGVSRAERRRVTEEFTHNPHCQVLVATDAAGEGLNLQAAHLMVNYDLPWNPNRIEQRFGRIHRIGQENVCRLWNLVAVQTREGEVFRRLLDKLEQMRETYQGRVFDVLGEAFSGTSLRELLIKAIRHGDDAGTRIQVEAAIDITMDQNLIEILDREALASPAIRPADLPALRAAMDDARARRLQPHYIELAFTEAFTALGGRIARRERGRHEISHVPGQLRSSTDHAIASRYRRVTFDLDRIRPDGAESAELLAPGHPLHDSVMKAATFRWGHTLDRGTVLASDAVDQPQVLVGLLLEAQDATGATVDQRFEYVFVDADGNVAPGGAAPYLDCSPAPESPTVEQARRLPWLLDAEAAATRWLARAEPPHHVNERRERRTAELERVRGLVTARLQAEMERLMLESMVAAEGERAGMQPRESSVKLTRQALELEERLSKRLARLDLQQRVTFQPARIVSRALVLPSRWFAESEADTSLARETKAVERRGVELVLSAEERLGRQPVEQPFNNKGFDILSTTDDGHTIRIEVKARMAGAKEFFVSHSEVVTGKNSAPRYRLALVRVDPRGPDFDEVRYVEDPFATTDMGSFEVTGIWGDWDKAWSKGRAPF